MDKTVTDILDLRARVLAMRELGVQRWADIELGPVPGRPVEDNTEQSAALERQERERVARVRFAASGGPRFGNRT